MEPATQWSDLQSRPATWDCDRCGEERVDDGEARTTGEQRCACGHPRNPPWLIVVDHHATILGSTNDIWKKVPWDGIYCRHGSACMFQQHGMCRFQHTEQAKNLERVFSTSSSAEADYIVHTCQQLTNASSLPAQGRVFLHTAACKVLARDVARRWLGRVEVFRLCGKDERGGPGRAK
jgi:hypothetical protein